MASSFFAMPIIVLNMGGEMVYILNQRLQAQSVQDEKAKKVNWPRKNWRKIRSCTSFLCKQVLQDVMKAMYSPLFVQVNEW